MAKTRVLVEFGMGTSLRRADYTEAAKELIDDLYAYDHGSVAFKPTFSYNPHVLSDTTNIENGKWHYAAPPPTGNGPGPEL